MLLMLGLVRVFGLLGVLGDGCKISRLIDFATDPSLLIYLSNHTTPATPINPATRENLMDLYSYDSE